MYMRAHVRARAWVIAYMRISTTVRGCMNYAAYRMSIHIIAREYTCIGLLVLLCKRISRCYHGTVASRVVFQRLIHNDCWSNMGYSQIPYDIYCLRYASIFQRSIILLYEWSVDVSQLHEQCPCHQCQRTATKVARLVLPWRCRREESRRHGCVSPYLAATVSRFPLFPQQTSPVLPTKLNENAICKRSYSSRNYCCRRANGRLVYYPGVLTPAAPRSPFCCCCRAAHAHESLLLCIPVNSAHRKWRAALRNTVRALAAGRQERRSSCRGCWSECAGAAWGACALGAADRRWWRGIGRPRAHTRGNRCRTWRRR